LDKDDFLEQLFDQRGTGDSNWRTLLSRESDGLFQNHAQLLPRVILVSHWRPQGRAGPSGTSIEWLSTTFTTVIELYCVCPVDIAAERFTTRERHRGHLDHRWSLFEVKEWMRDYNSYLPLKLGREIRVDTADKVELEMPLANICRVVNGDADIKPRS
jgi:glucokinase